jgi:hypothetical protein
VEILRVAGIRDARAGDITFVAHPIRRRSRRDAGLGGDSRIGPLRAGRGAAALRILRSEDPYSAFRAR